MTMREWVKPQKTLTDLLIHLCVGVDSEHFFQCHQESEEDEDDSNSSDSDEPSTPAPTTASPEVFTEEPVTETTQEPILPTIVTDNGRGDSMGGYPDDYKSILYIEDKSYHKVSGPYKPYEYVDTEKKTGYDMNHGNEVEKSMQVYKVQVSTSWCFSSTLSNNLAHYIVLYCNHGHICSGY